MEFTNEEKVFFASAFYKVHKEVIFEPFMKVFVYAKDSSILRLSSFCMDKALEVGVTPDIAEKTPLSKYVWDNMSLEKKQYLIKQFNLLEKEFKNAGGSSTILFVTKHISDIYNELKAYPYHHDDSGFHFEQFGV